MNRDFLNGSILGEGGGNPNGGFRLVVADSITPPNFERRFSDVFPTMWAEAYSFRKLLEIEIPKRGAGPAIAQERGVYDAIEEWVSLFLLHYFGLLHLAKYNRPEGLEAESLWKVIEGTYPANEPSLSAVWLLETDDDPAVVVGAYYLDTLFFPSRGRELWSRSKRLEAFLSGRRLSWEKCKGLLNEDQDRQRFHSHLRAIATNKAILPNEKLAKQLTSFCEKEFGGSWKAGALSGYPWEWKDIPGQHRKTEQELLDAYPLKKKNNKGGTTYYLLTDFPFLAPWMTESDRGNPLPINYRKELGGSKAIRVRLPGYEPLCKVQALDEVVLLKTLFLPRSPVYCKVPREPAKNIARVKSIHDVSLSEASFDPHKERAICLLPVTGKFLVEFPEILQQAEDIEAKALKGEEIEWRIPICGKEIIWLAKHFWSADLPKASLALWPPKTSKAWRLYVMYGTGDKQKCGLWHLLDEQGKEGQFFRLDEEEYVSVLHVEGSGQTPNRPRAIFLKDDADDERGILFLEGISDSGTEDERKSTLAVDLGTSNTCLAVSDGESEVLKFSANPEASLSPLRLWGQEHEKGETPGFVPNKWGGEKGFFPTMLLSRRYSEAAPGSGGQDELQLEQLFKVDVPSLHKNLDLLIYQEGGLNKAWRIHTGLKWTSDAKTPWRRLFLELVLLYAHAEVFFNRRSRIVDYVFTYPLAFAEDYGDTYRDDSKEAIRKIRHLCFGEDLGAEPNFRLVDESSAIARSKRETGAKAKLEVFIDVGGGTADLAIRHHDDFLVLDSVRIGGNAFFRFAKRNFETDPPAGAPAFKRHLGQLLQGNDQELNIGNLASELRSNLGMFYSVAINELSSKTFNEREESVRKQLTSLDPEAKDGKNISFQHYRSRLFFRHIFAYALLQVCAAAVSNKITPSNGIKLILGGNGWGLLMFAGFERKRQQLIEEANKILELLKPKLIKLSPDESKLLIESLRVTDLVLLNESDLADAKTCVALGALTAPMAQPKEKAPYTGVTIRKFALGEYAPQNVYWYDRWSFEALAKKFPHIEDISEAVFEQPTDLGKALSPTLDVFIALGNKDRVDESNLPKATWQNINAETIRSIRKVEGRNRRISISPLNHFLSSVLYPPKSEDVDFLDDLAKANDRYYTRK